MEHYRTTCPRCESSRSWVGYKTGFGKTQEQLEQMRKEKKTCIHCGYDKAETRLDGLPFYGQNAEHGIEMLKVLHSIERQLPTLLQDETGWQSMFIDYEYPIVKRIWRQLGDHRVYLHKIHSCYRDKAFFHPHPWPSAMRILKGAYEMGLGYGNPNETPPTIMTTLVLEKGSEYVMDDINAWHYVRPVTEHAYSLMVTDLPWGGKAPKSNPPLQSLNSSVYQKLFHEFQTFYAA